MKILHTADWHVGKRLGRYDRAADYAAALGGITGVAEREAVDLVIVAGDLFDRPTPPISALRQVLETLEKLATDERPVVAIAGNHDSPELFDLLAPLMRSRGVHLVGSIRPPEEGGVLDLETGGGRALVACFPFLREGRVVDFLAAADEWHGAYADKVAQICARYSDALAAGGDGAVKLLTAHFMVHGALLGAPGLPRGERAIHLGEAYTASEQAIPAGPQYVAMGHIHAAQPVPGSVVAAHYSGSPLELDFGEAGEPKGVVLVDVQPGGEAKVRGVPLTSGRRLLRARGPWDELVERDDLREAFLDLTVVTDGPDPGVADRARQEFPHLVKVQVDYERQIDDGPLRAGLPWDELYRDYYQRRHGTEPSAELLDAFRDVYDEASDAPG
ncbi:MAG: exonuclease SbcCD subunit D [bacterium]|nr:exonuclease SbcCD subunit D [bacterium]